MNRALLRTAGKLANRMTTRFSAALAKAHWAATLSLCLPAAVAVLLFSNASASETKAGPRYKLEPLLQMARTQSPLLAVSRSEEAIARAGTTTAKAWPNTEFDFQTGYASGRAGSPSGFAPAIAIAQPLENPWLRASRQQTARTRVDLAESQTGLTQSMVIAEVKRRFIDVARLHEEVHAFREDQLLTEQIRQRVQVRVRTGEAPRFDLIRAETEVAVVAKSLEGATLRLRQALSLLRQSVSPALEVDFDITPDPTELALLGDADPTALRARLLQDNPEVALAQRELDRASAQLEQERTQLMPSVSLRASHDRDPSVLTTRIGAQLHIPIFNRREGPIAEAQAGVERAKLQLESRQFELQTGFEAALQSYRVAESQVRALENGIIGRSRSVVEVAEAAYRFGERGILDYLDAQRQFRLVRNELIQARLAARLARVELERLAGYR